MSLQKTIFKCYSRTKKVISTHCYSTDQNPALKTWNVLTQNVEETLGGKDYKVYPQHADIVIIGGGFIGAAIAYWLKSRAVHGLDVVIVEKDITVSNISNL